MKSLIMIVVLIAVLAGSFAAANAGGEKPVETDPTYACRHTFENASEARKTCTSVSMTKIGTDSYRVSARCEVALRAGQYKDATVTVTDSRRCGDLTNCNGKLVVGACLDCVDKRTMRKIAC